MATLEQIAEALKRADAAGNAEDAKALAAAYRQKQAEGQGQPQGQKIYPLQPGLEGLPIPGTFDPARDTPSPNLSFGLSQSDTLNPLPMINAFGNNLASSIPIAGPYLKKAGENVDAWFDNTVTRPLMGQPGTTKPEDVAAYNADIARQNPIAAETGKVVGSTMASCDAAVNNRRCNNGPLNPIAPATTGVAAAAA